MYLTKAGVLAILAFSKLALANIYPDEDPCNPVPALEGEFQGEFDLRMELAESRCDCEFPPPAAGEQQDEYEERNRIDGGRCGPPAPDYAPEQWFDPGPLPDMGPIIVPIPVGGWGPGVPDWRHRGGWRNPRWRSGGGPGRPGRPGRHFDRRPPKPRGPRGGRQPFRGNRGPGGFNPGHRDPPRNNPPPHREPPRPAPHRDPPRPQPHREPPKPFHGGRPGHP